MSNTETVAAPRTRVTEHPAGDIWWVDLGSPDIEASKMFYGDLFGWTFEQGEFGYNLAHKGSDITAGVMQQSDEMKAAGAPCVWSAYINVDDIKKTVATATSLGATVIVEPMEVSDSGWMAFVQDPSGAAIGLWQPRNHTGATLFNSSGAFSWAELRTHDVPAAKAFYTKLFGWTVEATDMGGSPYTGFMHNDNPAAGLSELAGAELANVPAHWAITFGVDDVKVALDVVARHGGKVTYGPVDLRWGTLYGIVDPTGVALNIIGFRQA